MDPCCYVHHVTLTHIFNLVLSSTTIIHSDMLTGNAKSVCGILFLIGLLFLINDSHTGFTQLWRLARPKKKVSPIFQCPDAW